MAMKRYTLTADAQMEARLNQISSNLGVSKAEVIRKSLGLMLAAEREISAGNQITVSKNGTLIKEIVIS